VGALRDASEQAFQRSAGICDLLIGAKGSSLDLTLNALYHMGASQGNIPYSLYGDVRKTDGVLWSVPMVVGDSYQGFRVVGVTDDLFNRLEVPDVGKLQFSAGAPFKFSGADLDDFHAEVVEHSSELHEPEHVDEPGAEPDSHDHHDHDLADLASDAGWFVAVIGSQVAKETDLQLNSFFEPAHNLSDTGGEQHEEAESKVIGVLKETGTPMDRAIFIPAGAFYAIKGHEATEQSSFGGALDPHGLSAILVRSKPGYYHLQVRKAINDRLDAQAAQPAQEIRKLFAVVGNLDAALRMIAFMVVIVALTGVLVAIYNTMGARQKEFAILRALGARRRTVLGLVTAESATISLIGGLLGMVVAGIGVMLASDRIQDLTGVSISAAPDLHDLQFLIAITLMGALAGLVPAVRAYRTEAARHLSASL
jgi:putative ABC transport system permease protein